MFDKVKIFTIATNNYNSFSEGFLKSFSNLFLPDIPKEFVVFTDEPYNDVYKRENVTTSFIEHEGWPMITLKRYKNILGFIEGVGESELCIFADIDLEVKQKVIGLEVDKYFGTCHPGNFVMDMKGSLETNLASRAYIDQKGLPEDFIYIQGCLWGGVGESFKSLIRGLSEAVTEDSKNNIVSKWHDESHLNRFYVENFDSFSILPPSFAYPDGWLDDKIPFSRIISHKEKKQEEFPRFSGVK